MLYQNMEVQITGLDMSSASETIDRQELMKILELILEEVKIRMYQLLLSKTSTALCLGKDFTESFNTNKGSLQKDVISGVSFNIAFGNGLRDLHSELNRNNPNTEHSYSKVSFLSTEKIVTFQLQVKKKSNAIKTETNNILNRHSLKVNNNKWGNTTITQSKNRPEKVEWTNTKKSRKYIR